MLCISNTNSPAARRPLAHPFLQHTHIASQAAVCVCVFECVPHRARELIGGFPEQSESLSMRDNLSDAVYLSYPALPLSPSFFLLPFLPFPTPSPTAILSDLMFMYLTLSSCSSMLPSKVQPPLSVFLSPSLLRSIPCRKGQEDMNKIKLHSKKDVSFYRLKHRQKGSYVCCLLKNFQDAEIGKYKSRKTNLNQVNMTLASAENGCLVLQRRLRSLKMLNMIGCLADGLARSHVCHLAKLQPKTIVPGLKTDEPVSDI